MSRLKVSTTVYIKPEQDAQLKLLHVETKVPQAEMIRQGIDLYLETQRVLLRELEGRFLEDHPDVILDEPEAPSPEVLAEQMKTQRREAFVDAVRARIRERPDLPLDEAEGVRQ